MGCTGGSVSSSVVVVRPRVSAPSAPDQVRRGRRAGGRPKRRRVDRSVVNEGVESPWVGRPRPALRSVSRQDLLHVGVAIQRLRGAQGRQERVGPRPRAPRYPSALKNQNDVLGEAILGTTHKMSVGSSGKDRENDPEDAVRIPPPGADRTFTFWTQS